MQPLVQELYEAHQAIADAAKAPAMSAYMKNHFPFLGISSPERRLLIKSFFAKYSPPQYPTVCSLVEDLWALPERELHYSAIEILISTKKTWTVDAIHFFEKCLIQKSWWDSVDYISSQWVAPYFLKYPHQIRPITENWMASGNIWLQRVCLIFQLTYKSKTDVELMFDYIRRLNGSKEFFIQKAIGWALRQYARTDAAAVRHFVETTSLPPLSKREALKHLNQ
jgi:3-methyladenine DNA glycosylase AlkD